MSRIPLIRTFPPPGVVIVRSDLSLNGPGIFAISLARGLAGQGSPVVIACGKISGEVLDLSSRFGIAVIEIRGLCRSAGLEALGPGVIAALVKVGVRLSGGRRAVVFHGLNYRSALAGRAAAVLLGARGIASGAVATAVGYGAEKAVRFFPFPVVAISAHGRALLERVGISPAATIGCGTADPVEYMDLQGRKEELRAGLRARFGWPGDAFVACTMASHNPLKGTVDIPGILSRAPELWAVVLGDGPLRDEVAIRARPLGVSRRLALLPAEVGRLELLCGCDLLLHPSRAETFCMAASEAMTLGLPVAAYSAGALPETIGRFLDQVPTDASVPGCPAGFLSSPGDIETLAGGVSFLVRNPTFARRMGAHGAEIARNRDRLTRTVSEYLRVYGAIVIKSCHA